MRDSTWGEFLAQLGGVVPWGTGSSLVGWGKFGVAVYVFWHMYRRICACSLFFPYWGTKNAFERGREMGKQRGNCRQAKRKERKETVKNTRQNELNTIKLRMPPPKSQYGYGPSLNSEGMGMFPCGELASFTLLSTLHRFPQ